MPELDHELQAYYADAALSPEMLATLMAHARPKPRRRRWPWIAVALAAVLALLVWLRPGPTVPEEIAKNHLKASAPTVLSAQYAQLGAHLPRLDFEPIASERLDAYRVVGARYCSVNGHLAAQIQLRDARGRRFTLYQTVAAAAPEAAAFSSTRLGDVRVDTWHEAGLLFGLAGPADPPLESSE
jgi:hypothetical protein